MPELRLKPAVVLALCLLPALGACTRGGIDRNRPDEFAVGRQAPLVIPPDYALVPPRAGAPRPQDQAPSQQALEALFGGAAPRSAAEGATLGAAGRDAADPGVRSSVGDPETPVVDKGAATRDVIAAPAQQSDVAKAQTPQ